MFRSGLLSYFETPTPWHASWRRNMMQALFLFFLTFITIMSIAPGIDDDSAGNLIVQWIAKLLLGTGAHGDKVTHFIAYGVLAGTGILGRLSLKGRPLYLAIGLIVWSALMEIAQYFTGYRVLDVYDLLANSIGAIAGFLTACLILLYYDKWRRAQA